MPRPPVRVPERRSRTSDGNVMPWNILMFGQLDISLLGERTNIKLRNVQSVYLVTTRN